jgi:hypothetical protein
MRKDRESEMAEGRGGDEHASADVHDFWALVAGACEFVPDELYDAL